MEEYRTIIEFPNYQVSNFGNIKNIKNIKTWVDDSRWNAVTKSLFQRQKKLFIRENIIVRYNTLWNILCENLG